MKENLVHNLIPTIKNVLNSIRLFLNFSVGRRVYVGIPKSEIDVIFVRLQEMCKVLKPDSQQRKTEVKMHKAQNLITPANTLAWGISDHIKGVRHLIKKL